MRVVSLVPSATESLCLLGGGAMLVGRSHECDYPAEVDAAPALTSSSLDPDGAPDAIDARVAGALQAGQSLYRLDLARLRAARPDLIITQDLCSVCSIDVASVRGAASMLDPSPAILSLNPGSYEDVLDDLIRIGRAVGLETTARERVVMLRERFFRSADYVNSFSQRPRVVLLEWMDPLFVGGHWTPQLIERAGAEHPLNPTRALEGAGAGAGAQMAHRVAGPSVRVTPEQVESVDPDMVIVCPCGVRLEAIPAHMQRAASSAWWRGLRAVRAGRVALVDGTAMFSRPGPRLVDAYEWLVGWINDRHALIPDGFPWREAER